MITIELMKIQFVSNVIFKYINLKFHINHQSHTNARGIIIRSREKETKREKNGKLFRARDVRRGVGDDEYFPEEELGVDSSDDPSLNTRVA